MSERSRLCRFFDPILSDLCFMSPLCGFQTAFEALVQLDEQAVSVQL